VDRRCTGPSAASSKATWKPRSAKNPARGRNASFRVRRRRCYFIDITSLLFGPGTSGTLSGTTLTVTDGETTETLTVIVPVPSGQTVNVVTSADTFGGTLVGLEYSGGSNVISAGETRTISSGETSAGLTILFGGTLLVLSGGTASGTVDSGVEVLSGGTEIGGTVASGGVLTVSAGGTASGTSVSSGGSQVISAGGTAVSATLSGGILFVSNGLRFTSSAAQQTVLSGGTASATTVGSGALARVFAGAITVGDAIIAGGIEILSGGSAISSTISGIGPLNGNSGSSFTSYGDLLVLSGGLAEAPTVFSGGLVPLHRDYDSLAVSG
jgi:autotransporter passenger strand-loop-strand repeat protein